MRCPKRIFVPPGQVPIIGRGSQAKSTKPVTVAYCELTGNECTYFGKQKIKECPVYRERVLDIRPEAQG